MAVQAAGVWDPFYCCSLVFIAGHLSAHLTAALLTAETCQ